MLLYSMCDGLLSEDKHSDSLNNARSKSSIIERQSDQKNREDLRQFSQSE